MQKIERYGVIALVVLLVTILAVSLWGESGWKWKFWEKDAQAAESATLETPRQRRLQRQGGETLKDATGGLPMHEPIITPSANPSTPLANPGTPTAGLPLQAQPVASNAPLSPALPTPETLTTPTSNFGVAQNASSVQQQPLRSTQPTPAPSTSGSREYTVRSGDTLGAIAARELGSSSRWTEIQSLNGNLDPKRLKKGMTLTLPAGAAPAKRDTAPETNKVATAAKTSVSGRSYVVKSGDTLSKIAARELGDGERWNEIAALNPGLDANKLKVGKTLTLPGGAVAKAETNETRIGWSPRSEKKSAVQ